MTIVLDPPQTDETADRPDRRVAGAGRSRPRYIPALDGIRALAVVAVVLYHLDVDAAAGGFLGVEVFFVLSGYLITTLLLRDRRRRRRIELRAFWGRRARRLLPAVITMIAVVCGLSAVFRTTDLVNFRDDGLASLLYVQNWWGIIDHRPYFEEFGRPSPFMHLWSLAIEEQFYLLWPIALAAALRYLDKAKAFAVTLVLAGASVWAMAHMADIERIERSYYGTDSRAFGLLLGAAMAFVWKPGDRLRAAGTGAARLVLNIVSVAAVAGLVWQLAGRSEYDGWTFPWGLLWVDLLSLVLVAAAVAPRTVIAKALGLRPLAAIGRRSYSLYLWHWPVIVFMRPGEDMPVEGWTAHLVRIAVMVALAELSYRLVEQPFRTGRVSLALPAGPVARWRSPRHAVAGSRVAAALVLVVVAATLTGPPSESPLAAPVSSSPPAVIASSTTTTQPAPTSTTPPSTAPAPPSTVSAPTTPPTQPPTTAPSGPASSVPVSVIGESVTLAAEGELEQRFTTASIDAAVGRQFSDTESLVAMLAAQNALSHTVVVHVGNNGPIPEGGLDDLLRAVGDRRLILLTVNVPRRWESQVNDSLHAFVRDHPQVALIDWKAAVQADPGLVGGDGVHLTRTGIHRYVDLIAGAVTAI